MFYEKELDLKTYIKQKIKTLKQLGIHLERDQIAHLDSLDSELQVDNYVHDLIVMKEVY